MSSSTLYFAMDDSLWAYDGETPPVQVADEYPARLISFDDQLYFSSTNSHVLYRYDEDEDSTLVFEFDAEVWGVPIPEMLVHDGQLLVVADDGWNGTELWRYDGANDPVMLPEINTGECSESDDYTDCSSLPWTSGLHGSLAAWDDRLFLRADDGTTGDELWVYGALDSPATLIADLSPGEHCFDPFEED